MKTYAHTVFLYRINLTIDVFFWKNIEIQFRDIDKLKI